ncbi:MAG: hypothetical protein RJA99_711 [Pseudomonadota bacterium]|jgi:hypothetical protein
MSDPTMPQVPDGDAPDRPAQAVATDARSTDAVPTSEGPLPVGAADLPIPMLTEIVEVPRYAPETLPAELEDVDWAELAERVRENVAERLTRRSQALLDAALRDSLRAVVDRAAESLAAELRTSLTQMVRDIVGRAVDEEITRVHAEIARRPKP